MKIALLILHADPARGGAERYTVDLAAALAGAGHDVSLLASSFAEVPAGVRRIDVIASGLTRVGRYAAFLDALDAHLDHTPYDIVHAMLPVRRCDVYHPHAGLAVAAWQATRPLTRVFNPRRSRFASVERALLTGPHPPVVLCLSQYVKRSIREHYDLPDAQLRILFNAVDLDRFRPDPHPPRDEVRALFVGQDFARKGLVQALVALRQIDDPLLKLTVVGQPSRSFHWPDMREMRDRVAFVGATRDTRPFYRDADFFVLPTRHDPCSLVVLEALAMGLPVISTRFNGACEIMTDDVHGFVLDDPDDTAALAGAMRTMLDPSVRAGMSQACLELRPRLSYENHLRTLLSIYESVRGSA